LNLPKKFFQRLGLRSDYSSQSNKGGVKAQGSRKRDRLQRGVKRSRGEFFSTTPQSYERRIPDGRTSQRKTVGILWGVLPKSGWGLLSEGKKISSTAKEPVLEEIDPALPV